MRVFVQSLDGEARKWFRELPRRPIADIEALDDVFLKHCGDKRDMLYYHTKVSRLEVDQYSEVAGASCAFSLPSPDLYRGAKERMNIL